MTMRELLARCFDWIRRPRLERELAEELRFHRQRAERDAAAEGISADESVWVARQRFGNRTQVVEDSRERWSLPTLDHLQQDVRYALRGLRRSPGFTATAVLTLALGIGANVAMFGVVDELMFKPYPYLHDPASVNRLYQSASYRGQQSWDWCDQYTCYLDMRRFTSSFSELAGVSSTTMAVGDGDDAKERVVATVSASFWSFFDARPVTGRVFTTAEDTPPRGASVAVLGYDYWQSALGGRDVIGQRLHVGDITTTIIGVMPKGFTGVFEPDNPALYIPITLYAATSTGARNAANYYKTYNWGWMSTMARRKPGVTIEQASADVAQAFQKSWRAQQALESGMESPEIARPGGIAGPMKAAAGPDGGLAARTALWVWGVAAIVLLIACANVANLSLARALRRQREMAVRLALGVSRGRLARQLVTESLLLAALGGVVGVAVAQWGGRAIRTLLSSSGRAAVVPFMDWRVIAAVAVMSLAAGLLAGVAPAIVAARYQGGTALRSGQRTTQQRTRLRAALLVAQAALSVLLLVGAALFVRSLAHVRSLRMGYDAEQVLLVSTRMRGTQLDSTRGRALVDAILHRAQAAPGVADAASVTSVPIWSSSSTGLYVAGIDSVQRLGRFTFNVTTPNFFRTFGTRIVRGRAFGDADAAGAPAVMVVSASMAQALWPGQEAIGQCVHVMHETAPCTTVVGVAEDIVQKEDQLSGGKRLQYYLPAAQATWRGPSETFLVKVTGDPATQAEQLRRWLQPVMPGASYIVVRPLSDMLASVRRSWTLGADLFVAFGLLALVVAGVGLYGMLSYDVTRRFHELGVRVALGAQGRDILRLVVGHGTRLVALGVLLGVGLAYLSARWVEPLLFQESARDPMAYAAVAVLMLLVALVSSAVPARRASGADPNEALRAD